MPTLVGVRVMWHSEASCSDCLLAAPHSHSVSDSPATPCLLGPVSFRTPHHWVAPAGNPAGEPLGSCCLHQPQPPVETEAAAATAAEWCSKKRTNRTSNTSVQSSATLAPSPGASPLLPLLRSTTCTTAQSSLAAMQQQVSTGCWLVPIPVQNTPPTWPVAAAPPVALGPAAHSAQHACTGR